MKYFAMLIFGKCVYSMIRKIFFKIKDMRRRKNNERIMTTPGRWY